MMNCTYVKAPFQFELREMERPEPGPNEVLIRVAYCGVCGTDVSIARDKATDWTPLGHEVSGVVEAMGPGVSGLEVGMEVGLDCGNNCGICSECRAGRFRRCQDLRGYYGRRSGMADYLLTPRQTVHPLNGVDLKSGCLLEPFGVAMAMCRTLATGLLDDVLLIGPGPIGLLALATCQAQGARSLTVVSRSEGARSALSRQLGAEVVVASGTVEELLCGDLANSFDKIIVTAPPTLLPGAIAAARVSGVIAYCGLGEGKDGGVVAVDWDAIHGKDLTIRPMGQTPTDLPQALELMRRGVVRGDDFVTHCFGLREAGQAIGLLAEKDDSAVKVAIKLC